MVDMMRAQKLLEELKRNYIADLPTKFDDIELLILSIKKKNDIEEDIGELYRKVHSLKGSSGTHGLHDLSTVCHRFEDYLRALDGGQVEFEIDDVNRWIAHVDLMRRVLEVYNNGGEGSFNVGSELDAIANRQFGYSCFGLIVDESKSNAMLYQGALSNLPIKFTLMTDGYNALDVLLNNRFDLLVTSMELKRLNGVALIGAIKLANGVSKDIKTIMVTSKPDQVKQGQDICPDKLIVKGSDLADELLDSTKQLLKFD